MEASGTSFKLRYSKRVRRVTLQRYLCSKLFYEPDEVTIEDVYIIFDNQLWLEKKALRENAFFEKFGRELDSLSIILKNAFLARGLNSRTAKRLGGKMMKQIPTFLYPRRNYSSVKQRFSGRPVRLINDQGAGVPKRFLPPIKVIGKGYTDKGTLKFQHDGSPNWKELSSDETFQLREKEKTHERNSKVVESLVRTSEEFGQIAAIFQLCFAKTEEEAKQFDLDGTIPGALARHPIFTEKIKRLRPEVIEWNKKL